MSTAIHTSWPRIFLLLVATSCKEAPPIHDEDAERPTLVEALLALSDEARTTLEARAPTAKHARSRFEDLARRARAVIGTDTSSDAVTRLNRLLFKEMEFEREVERTDLELMLLPQVLESRRGSCLGLAAVYLGLAEALDLPIRGVLVPGHFFARYRRREVVVNIELLRAGEALEDGWYRERYQVPNDSSTYLRDLTKDEVICVLQYNVANEHRAQGRLRTALELYRRVGACLPGFAEAHANEGLIHQLAGRLELARDAYERARAAHPELPGLRENMQALEAAQGKALE